jgi:uracil phosphoribosyltransferase
MDEVGKKEGRVGCSPAVGREGPILLSFRTQEPVPEAMERAMPDFPNLTVLDHPLIEHKLSILRDVETGKKLFKELVDEITMLMAFEVTRELPLEEVVIRTPLSPASARRIAGKKLGVVPILRAGLGMVDAVLRLVPGARVGHVGLYRDEETIQPVQYYLKVPPPDGRVFIVVDPMLATGGSAVAAVSGLKDLGAEDIRFMCIVAAPEGVRAMLEAHPEVPVFAAALDEGLDENSYILPGLGDAGDRLFGTR